MKKLTLIILLVFMITLNFHTVYADDATWEKSFIDDFEAYELGKVETQTTFTDRWTNDSWSGENPTAADINDVATIKSESGNKFLNLKYGGSFFYMGPHNLRTKVFEVEFDTRSNDLTEAWVGVDMRKEYRDVRYNGGTGMMFYFRTKYLKDLDDNIIGETFNIQALRGASLSVTDLTADLTGTTSISYLYPTNGDPIDSTQQIKGNWFTIKIVVSETGVLNEAQYDVSVNGNPMASLVFARNSLNIYGYISLNACTSDIDIDNFEITALDTVAPAPIVRVNTLINSSGTVDSSIELPGFDVGDIELIDDVDGKAVIEIVSPTQVVTTLADGVFTFTPTEVGIYTVRYIAENSSALTGTAEFMINVQAVTVDPAPVVNVNAVVVDSGVIDSAIELPGANEDDIELIGDADEKVVIEIVSPTQVVTTLADEVFTFTPTEIGAYTVRYIAENNSGVTDVAEFTINIEAASDNPSSIIIWIVAPVGAIGLGALAYFFIIKKKIK